LDRLVLTPADWRLHRIDAEVEKIIGRISLEPTITAPSGGEASTYSNAAPKPTLMAPAGL
jgi:hypothetical protein